MNDNFLIADSIVRINEGGYVGKERAEKTKDTGGETFCGISRNNFPNWEGWSVIDSYKDKGKNPQELVNDKSMKDLVSKFFKQEFWDKLNLDLIAEKSLVIAVEMYDSAVNLYWRREAMFFQRILNALNQKSKYWEDIKVDGIIGQKTIDIFNIAIDKGDEDVIAFALNAEQNHYYLEITEKNQDNEIFYLGWIRNRGKDPFKVVSDFLKSPEENSEVIKLKKNDAQTIIAMCESISGCIKEGMQIWTRI